jgi:hypothetical protein
MKNVRLLLVCSCLAFGSTQLHAQGCSDSGFCTMGAFRPDQPYVKKLNIRINSLELTQHLGYTKYGDWIHSTFLDANVGINRKTSLQVRLPAYTIIEGNMPTTRGWGDLFFNLSRNVIYRDNYQINLTAGAKIFTSKPNKKSEEGLGMPMYQQTSYGSNDLSFGASLLTRDWLLATGYQRALNKIENNFNPQEWQGTDFEDVVIVYDQSAGLIRGDDFMLRAERNFRLSRFNFYAGALGIWRITSDKSLVGNGESTKVKGSTGLALNFVTGGGYQFSTRMGIRLLISAKLKERDANPDGLSRDFISQVAYIVRF